MNNLRKEYPDLSSIALADRATLLGWWLHLDQPRTDDDVHALNSIIKRLVEEPVEGRGK